MDFSADDGLVDLVLDPRDRLMVDCWSHHLVDGGVVVAVLDPELCQRRSGHQSHTATYMNSRTASLAACMAAEDSVDTMPTVV